MQDRRTSQGGVQAQTDEEPLERVRTAGSEIIAKAVAADVLHALLLGYGGHGGGGEVARELFVEEDKVCEATSDGGVSSLERRECALEDSQCEDPTHTIEQVSYVSSDEVRYKGVLCAVILLHRGVDGAV